MRKLRIDHIAHSFDPETKKELKQCCRCEKWLSLYRYWKNSQAWDGLVSWCKDCRSNPIRSRYQKIREQGAEKTRKVCVCCKVLKNRASYSKSSFYSDGMQRQCKKCRLKIKRKAKE